MTIAPAEFVGAMQDHWERLGNVPSDALRAAWLQLAEAFGQHVEAHGDPDRATEWTVLQPATGAGKSQGTAVYCGLLARFETTATHPGVVIVTRLKADADGMADTINRIAGKAGYALAYHSDAKGPGVLESLRTFPVLVITHRAYELALDHLGQGSTVRQTWPYFHDWGVGARRLVVIDEALDVVEESRGELEGLRLTLAAIPESVRKDHGHAVEALRTMVGLLEKIGEKTKGQETPERIVLREAVKQGDPPDFGPLRRALRDVRFDHQMGRSDSALSQGQWAIHDDRLRALDAIFRGWVYYSRVQGQGHTLNTARLLVPEGVKGAVVLDATASANLVYQLFEHARVLTPPAGVRSYRNVTLHVSRGHRVGKVAMRDRGEELIAAAFADLSARLPGRSVFVVTHKAAEALAVKQEATFRARTGHWGAVDGSNEWQDCEAAAVLGLPYRPDTWTANAFMALQGVQTTDWLRSDHRPFKDHDDIRAALKLGQVVTDLVQAINRIRCRRVIDTAGNCPTADVFLALPDGAQGDAIVTGVMRLMEGIRVVPWDLAGAPERSKRGRKGGTGKVAQTIEAATVHLRNALPGKVTKGELSHTLGMTPKAWDQLAAQAKDPGSALASDLAAVGVTYHVEGRGRGARSYFLKAA